jgi:SH3 domain-containing protein
MRGRVVIAASLTLVAAAVASGQGTSNKWVDRTKADVRAGRASYHDVVDTVLKGEQVAVLKTEEGWLNVRTPRNKNGWVFEKALSAKAVEPGGSEFLKNTPGGDASTSATAASAGAKGLYAEQYARSKGYDFSVVQWIEQHQPHGPDVEAFARSGAGR